MLGIGNQNGSGMTFDGYWKQLTIAFKCLAMLTLILAIFGIFSSAIALTLANIVLKTVNEVQIWRLFSSFLVDSNILNVLVNLYILSTLMPELVIVHSHSKKSIQQYMFSSISSSKTSTAIFYSSFWASYFLF
jgi:membrane associated rhomboid family serine protease